MSADNTGADLIELLSPYATMVDECLRSFTVPDDTPPELAQAMQYSVLGGGKRIRPALVFMAAKAVGGTIDDLTRRCAAAVELVHCYSLVHDDLPAMDNDTLRRGLPTVHMKFGQAMAILAGDALLTRAFEILARADSPKTPELAALLAQAAGSEGMIAGQVADMDLCTLPAGPQGLEFIHTRKTGALIAVAALMGAICGQADKRILQAVKAYGLALGLNFQIIDDLLDVTAVAAQLGKTPGKDVQAGKKTYVSVLGIEEARRRSEELSAQAVEALSPLGAGGVELAILARILADRSF